MVRLIVIIKQIFRTLVGLRLRVDGPTISLVAPPAEISFVNFDVDDALVRELIVRQRPITMRASKRTFPVQTRCLAILSFAAAGAFCSEISTLDFQDVSLTLASMKYVRVGRSAEQAIHRIRSRRP